MNGVEGRLEASTQVSRAGPSPDSISKRFRQAPQVAANCCISICLAYPITASFSTFSTFSTFGVHCPPGAHPITSARRADDDVVEIIFTTTATSALPHRSHTR